MISCCLLIKHVIQGKIEGPGRRGRRREELLDGFKGKRSYRSLERGVGSILYSVENSLLSRLWTCRNENYVINDGFVRYGLGDLETVVLFSGGASDFLLYIVNPLQLGSYPCGKSGTPYRVFACLVPELMRGVVLPVSPGV